MYKIIYGTDTESIEDYSQCVVLLIPDDVDDVEEYLDEHHYDDVPQQQIVCWEDIVESLALIMDAEGVSATTAQTILLSLGDAVTNND